MATKKELKKEAERLGADVPSDASKEDLERLVDQGAAGTSAEPPAGVEGRSIDTQEDAPNSEQSEEGTFEKVYVTTAKIEESELPKYERNIRQQAQQVGLRTTGDVSLDSQETAKDGVSIRSTFTVPVVRAASAEAVEVATVDAVVSDEEATEGEKEATKA